MTEDEESKRPSRSESFEAILLEAVNEGLAELGESVRACIYLYIESYAKIKRDAIPHELEAFSSAIERFFGSGAQVLERLILKKLSSKIGFECETVHCERLHIAVQQIQERLANASIQKSRFDT